MFKLFLQNGAMRVIPGSKADTWLCLQFLCFFFDPLQDNGMTKTKSIGFNEHFATMKSKWSSFPFTRKTQSNWANFKPPILVRVYVCVYYSAGLNRIPVLHHDTHYHPLSSLYNKPNRYISIIIHINDIKPSILIIIIIIIIIIISSLSITITYHQLSSI